MKVYVAFSPLSFFPAEKHAFLVFVEGTLAHIVEMDTTRRNAVSVNKINIQYLRRFLKNRKANLVRVKTTDVQSIYQRTLAKSTSEKFQQWELDNNCWVFTKDCLQDLVPNTVGPCTAFKMMTGKNISKMRKAFIETGLLIAVFKKPMHYLKRLVERS